MNGFYPPTDQRRRDALLRKLEVTAQRFVPTWRGLSEPGDPGRALLEIAAHLGAHVTSRLDRTAERDLRAFLNWLDLPVSEPTPAEAWLVFVLSDKLNAPVLVREAIQVGAETPDGAALIFETPQGLSATFTPARLMGAFAVDPAIDRIETAPPGFGSLEPPLTSDPVYQLLSFAPQRAERVQITPPLGLEPGDWIDIDGEGYRITEETDGIYSITPGLDAAAPAESTVRRITRMQPGTMRNVQEHAFYLGHKELLNIEQAAVIKVKILPEGRAQTLAGLDLEWALWATLENDDEPDWHALEAEIEGASVRLRKGWIGKTEEREVSGEKSLWLRARLRGPMEAATPLTCDRFELSLSSDGDAANAEVAAAFHNATPLPLPPPGTMLPFGSEPRLFDQFYLAAPEALSKKGATVTLDVDLADASILAMNVGNPDDAGMIGVGANGALQLLIDPFDNTPEWRELLNPDLEQFGLGKAEPSFGGFTSHPPAVMPLSGGTGLNCVVQQDNDIGWFWLAQIDPSAADAIDKVTWTVLDAPPDGPFTAFALADEPALVGKTQLLAVQGGKIWRRILQPGGQPYDDWEDTGFDAGAPIDDILPVRRSGDAAEHVVLRLEGGDLVHLSVADWQSQMIDQADEEIKIDAVHQNGVDLVSFANSGRTELRVWQSDGTATLRLDLTPQSPSGQSNTLPVSSGLSTGTGLAIVEELNGVDGSHLLFLQTLGGKTRLSAWRLPSERVLDLGKHPGLGSPVAGPLAIRDSDDNSRIVIADDNQRLRLINPTSEIPVDSPSTRMLHVVPIPNDTDTFLAEFNHSTTAPALWPVSATGISESGSVIALSDAGAPENPTENTVILWRDRAPNRDFTGDIIDDHSFRLDGADTVTAPARMITFGTRKFHVTAVSPSRVATLAESIGDPPGQVPYRSISNVSPAHIQLDIGRAVMLHEDDHRAAAPRLSTISVGGTESPVQAVATDGAWALLDTASGSGGLQNISLNLLPDQNAWQVVVLADATSNPELSWEYHDGRGWRRLDQNFIDLTGNLATSGIVEFNVPDALSATKIGGQEDYWIRAHLIGGDYGQPSYDSDLEFINGGPDFTQKVTIDRSDIRPPKIRQIKVSFKLDLPVAPSLTLVENNLTSFNQTAAAETPGAQFDLLAPAAAIDPKCSQGALYLAFSRPFAADALRFLIEAAEQEIQVDLSAEVLADGRWQSVAVLGDDTNGMHRTGLLSLSVVARPTRSTLFDLSAFWLRLSGKNIGLWRPDLGSIYPNAALATAVETVRQELLGSTIGEPNARFQLSRQPVIPGSLELRVRERLGEEARTAEGLDVRSNVPDLPGDWVLWRQVQSFADATPDGRVYMLDPRTGLVRFGDDRQGRIPPGGSDNLRAFVYRTGGGASGNVAAYAATSLKSAISGVEAVTNPLAARGGSDGRTDVAATIQAKAGTRHLGRALTVRDIEALALEFAPEIRAARCFRPEGLGRPLTVAIATTGPETMPQPSLALQDGLKRRLLNLGASSWSEQDLKIVGPDYIIVDVQLELAPADTSPVSLVADIGARLRAFLDPVSGGRGGAGWPFGRGLWPSDIHRALADLLGAARITELSITRRDGSGPTSSIPQTGIITVASQGITVNPTGGPP
ncbi:putative baseplate assembly protein [Ruegeria sp. MALMAid1280]|uniref:putative baseplate assembly protein n=1 Tax=Ruegeria sp. MALMAid1280 TaxID=3411634 RepID=UPI003BA39E68